MAAVRLALAATMMREVAVKALLFGVAGSITAGIANLVDVLWPLWDDKRQTFADKICSTVVLDHKD